jgi:competence protein ComEC
MARYIFLAVLFLIFLVHYQVIDKQSIVPIAYNPVSSLRSGMQRNLILWLPGDTGPLAAGILLGGNEGLSYQAKLAFRRTGLMHVTAASGYNVVVVAGWAMALGKVVLGRRRAIFIGVVSVIIYMYLAGLSSAVIRAGIMAILTLSAAFWGRKTDAAWILVLTSLLMLAVNPLWITDIGFQLSIAATAGLIFLAGSTSGLVVDDLKTTISAQIATLPLLMHHFGSMSLVAPVVNLMVLWTVPLIMQLTAMASGIGLVWPSAGGFVALLAWPLLAFMDNIVRWSASWPGANINVGNMGWIWVGVYYLAVILLMSGKKNETVV